MPNKVSSAVGEIWQSLTRLNQFKTFWVNSLVYAHSIKECSIESLSPQYRHSSSVFIPNLNNSFLVTIVLWINLNWNSFSLVSLQIFFSDLKILVHTSLFKESFSLQRLGPVWSSVWILTLNKKNICKETKLNEFQFKLIHRTIVTKKELFRFGIKTDDEVIEVHLCRFVEKKDIIILGKEWSVDGVRAFG